MLVVINDLSCPIFPVYFLSHNRSLCFLVMSCKILQDNNQKRCRPSWQWHKCKSQLWILIEHLPGMHKALVWSPTSGVVGQSQVTSCPMFIFTAIHPHCPHFPCSYPVLGNYCIDYLAGISWTYFTNITIIDCFSAHSPQRLKLKRTSLSVQKNTLNYLKIAGCTKQIYSINCYFN